MREDPGEGSANIWKWFQMCSWVQSSDRNLTTWCLQQPIITRSTDLRAWVHILELQDLQVFQIPSLDSLSSSENPSFVTLSTVSWPQCLLGNVVLIDSSSD